jgi:transposase
MISVPSNSTVLALDVHKFSITAAVLEPGSDSPVLDRLGTDEESVRRLVSRLGAGRSISACYEAGPTGYELARHLEGLGVHCDVVAPSLIPKAPGDRVKTDRRDARRLAHLLRAGQLTAVNVPSPAEEAVRDLCRARTDMVIDRVRAQHRLDKFLLRHGRVYLEDSRQRTASRAATAGNILEWSAWRGSVAISSGRRWEREVARSAPIAE